MWTRTNRTLVVGGNFRFTERLLIGIMRLSGRKPRAVDGFLAAK